MAEWWDGPFYAWFYDPYRKIVEKSFRATKPGFFAHYSLQRGLGDSFLNMLSQQQVWWLGLAAGFGAGYLIRDRQR